MLMLTKLITIKINIVCIGHSSTIVVAKGRKQYFAVVVFK